jgi:cytochrome b561
MWRNTAASFGLVSRALHWAMALLILALLALGLTLSAMQPALANLWLYELHKTMGVTALVLVLVRLIWHRISPPPKPLGTASDLPQRLARAVHALIYTCLVVIPLAGWVGSSATGIDTVIFDSITLPPIAPVSEAWDAAAFVVHRATAWVLIALLGLHIAGAALRATKGERTLARMIRGS